MILILRILNDFELHEKIFCIITDNSLNNTKMAREIFNKTLSFDSLQHFLGCIGHVIHMAAKQGIKSLCST